MCGQISGLFSQPNSRAGMVSGVTGERWSFSDPSRTRKERPIRPFIFTENKGVKEHVTSASPPKEYMVNRAFVQASFVFEHTYILYLLEYSRLLASTRWVSVVKVICKYCIHLHPRCVLFQCHTFWSQ